MRKIAYEINMSVYKMKNKIYEPYLKMEFKKSSF